MFGRAKSIHKSNLTKNHSFFGSSSLKTSRAIREAAPRGIKSKIPLKSPVKTLKIDTLAKLQAIIKSKEYSQIRVFGGRHSVESSIYAEQDTGITLELVGKEFRDISFVAGKSGVDEQGEYNTVKVGAGCHLGSDPLDASSLTWNLNSWLFHRGYALIMLGGITHQSVGGFLSTGSAGGSAKFSLAESVESITFVNGKGELITAEREQDLFNAVIVSMGLFGIIVAVTFKVRPVYTVQATEEIVQIEKSWLCKTTQNTYPLEKVLKENCYVHLNWTTASDRVMQWTGKKLPAFKLSDICTFNPYVNPMNALTATPASWVFAYMDDLRSQSEIKEEDMAVVSDIFKFFMPLGTTSKKPFRDYSHRALPTENTVPVHGAMKTEFAEIWFPIEQTTLVIDTLKEFYQDFNTRLATYAVELYVTKHSSAWLSPACEGDVLRVDPLWCANNKKNNCDEFFTKFFQCMLAIPGARLHWGKHLPKPGLLIQNKYKAFKFNIDYLKQIYLRLPEWLKFREEHDADGLFLNAYWAEMFDIPYSQKLTLNHSEVKSERKLLL